MCSETVECNVLLGPQFINYLNQVYTALCLNLKYFWHFFFLFTASPSDYGRDLSNIS